MNKGTKGFRLRKRQSTSITVVLGRVHSISLKNYKELERNVKVKQYSMCVTKRRPPGQCVKSNNDTTKFDSERVKSGDIRSYRKGNNDRRSRRRRALPYVRLFRAEK